MFAKRCAVIISNFGICEVYVNNVPAESNYRHQNFVYNFVFIDVKEVKITGNTTVMEGETLNLTCSVESFPPSVITWTRILDKNTQTNQQNNTLTDLHNDTLNRVQEESGMGTFSISNMAAEDSGQFICKAKHLNSTLMEIVDVKVICKCTVQLLRTFLCTC